MEPWSHQAPDGTLIWLLIEPSVLVESLSICFGNICDIIQNLYKLSHPWVIIQFFFIEKCIVNSFMQSSKTSLYPLFICILTGHLYFCDCTLNGFKKAYTLPLKLFFAYEIRRLFPSFKYLALWYLFLRDYLKTHTIMVILSLNDRHPQIISLIPERSVFSPVTEIQRQGRLQGLVSKHCVNRYQLGLSVHLFTLILVSFVITGWLPFSSGSNKHPLVPAERESKSFPLIEF